MTTTNNDDVKELEKYDDILDFEQDTEAAQRVLEEYDPGYNHRKQMPAIWKWVIYGISVLLSTFQLYTAFYGTLPSNQQRGFHVALALGLIFLLYPANAKKKSKVTVSSWLLTLLFIAATGYLYFDGEITLLLAIGAFLVLVLLQFAKYYQKDYFSIPLPDLLLAVMGISVGLYHFIFYRDIVARVGIYSDIDYIIAGIGLLLVLGAAKRAVGTPIIVVAVAMLLYAYFGPHLPFMEHRGFSVQRIISHSFLSMEGIFGIPIAISTTFIFLYMMFGVILRRTGLEEYFTDLAMSLAGWMTGGTAKVGVLTSVFSGMITGSSVANTVGNGAFTIPMMKRAGYKPEFAAAVEAASSTGGQLTPPIMGAAAFLMIEFTGLQYVEIMKAAIIPTLLFFTAQFIVIHYESKRLGIMGIPRDRLQSISSLIMTKGYLLLPIVAIFVILAIGQSPQRAATMGIFVGIAVNLIVMAVAFLLGKYKDLKYRVTLPVFFDILKESAWVSLPVIAACAAAGVISGVITLTGLGLRIAGGILDLANNQLLLTMFFTMIGSIVLGMGLPTTANYVITATMAAPALLAFDNLPIIAAHMFVFYFGIMADITPPVALAAYAGSGLAQSNPFQTGVQSVRIAIGGFLVPYMFVLSPELLLSAENQTILTVALAIGSALLGMYCVGTSVIGYIERNLHIYQRVILAAAGLSLLYAGWMTDVIGLVVFLSIYITQVIKPKKAKESASV